ncbi:MAG: hypothetical protein ACOX9C_01165 [Kiritimatiellia bacterium]
MPTTTPHRRLHLAFALLALAAACAPEAHAQGAVLVPVRSNQSLLPESIRRETFATIDRTRATLLSRQDDDGLWTLADGSRTVFPALALCDPFFPAARELDAALAAADAWLAERAAKPWTARGAAEAIYATLAQLLHRGRPPGDRLATRLSRIRLDALPHDDAALALAALDYLESAPDGGWAGLVNRLRAHRPPAVDTVAIAALARFNVSHARHDLPTRDVQEHLRWIAEHAELGTLRRSADAKQITPPAAFFLAVVAAQLPRRAFLDERPPLPVNWRNTLANRLIERQRVDSATGLNYWDSSPAPSPTSDSALRETTFAIMTLVILAE